MVPILTQEEIDALLHGPSEDECDRDNFYTRVRVKFLRLAKTLRERVCESKTEEFPDSSRHPRFFPSNR